MDPFGQPPERNKDAYSPGFVGGYPHAPHFDYSYDGTMRSVEQSLLRMGLSRLDVVLIHDCDVWTHGKADAGRRFKEAMEGAYRALDKLRSEKTVAAIGFGINEADTCVKFARAGDFDLAMMAGRYSLLIQNGLAEFLPLAVEKKMGVMLAGVFNSGILATGAIPGAKFEYAPAPAGDHGSGAQDRSDLRHARQRRSGARPCSSRWRTPLSCRWSSGQSSPRKSRRTRSIPGSRCRRDSGAT